MFREIVGGRMLRISAAKEVSLKAVDYRLCSYICRFCAGRL